MSLVPANSNVPGRRITTGLVFWTSPSLAMPAPEPEDCYAARLRRAVENARSREILRCPGALGLDDLGGDASPLEVWT